MSATRAAHAVRFIETYCRHTKGRWAGSPLKLERWQREDVVVPLFGATRRDGRRLYTEALIGIPRKNGKSTLASALALYLLIADDEPGAEVYSAAGDKAQARIVFGQAAEMVRASPHLRAWCRVFRDVIEVPETGAIYRVLSSDAPLKHGLNVHAAVIDELHAHRDPELYYALQSGTGARRQPLVISITTAGREESGTIARQLYDMGSSKARRDARFFFRWWGVDEQTPATDRKAWRRANPASWVTLEYLTQQSRRLPENVFRRLHLNQWTRQEDRWLPMDRWDACDAPPAIPDGAPCVIAVDAAPKRDTTAVVLAHRDDAGDVHAEAEVFTVDERTGLLDFAAVEDHIRELARAFDVERVLYDPYHFSRSARDLEEEGVATFEDVPQTDARMVPISQALFDVVVDGRLRHGGDPVLREQADAAAAKETSRGWRLHKMKATRPIDAVVALAIAVHHLESEAGPADVTGVVV